MIDLELAEEIERLVALSEKATQGKWSSEDGYLIGYPPKSRPNGEGITQFACAVDPNFPRSKADGEFVAALVNWFRANIAALRRGPEHKSLDDLDEPYFYLRGYRKRWRSFSHFNGDVISYDDIVEWSGIDSDREVIRERIYTITYAMPHGSKRPDGSLAQGESTPFESGMVFNISRTEKA